MEWESEEITPEPRGINGADNSVARAIYTRENGLLLSTHMAKDDSKR